jgi:hypothetical protein
MKTDLDGKRPQSNNSAPYLEGTLMVQTLRLAVKDVDRVEPCHDQMFHSLIFGEITFERVVYSRGRMHRADDLHTERQPLNTVWSSVLV